MNKSLKAFCCIAMLAALVLVSVLFLNYRDLGSRLRETESLLSASRETWENTAAEKEKLQEDRKALESDLKEANLSLSEARERAVTLKQDIETLNGEIAELKQKLTSP